MNRSKTTLALMLLGWLVASAAATAAPAERPAAKSEPEIKGTARVVVYNERDIISIHTRLRYTTLIQLPPGELIMDYVIGDKDFWIVNGAANLAYVKPAKAAATTNLNLVTTRGIVYSFVLAEVGESGVPDLKLFIQSGDEAMSHALNSPPKYVPVEQVEDYRQQAEIARTQVREVKQAAQKATEGQVSVFQRSYPTSLNFGYRFERGKKPFDVTAIFDDGKFTYLKAHPTETPTLYEIKDGTPNLVKFDYRDGVYTVGKVLESGYLAIGKKRFTFTKER
jgi:type IV secretory pathway VirB9-like protein